MMAVLFTSREGARAHGQTTLLNVFLFFYPRSVINALHRRSVYILIGRRVRALESNSTGLPIGLDLPEQRGAAGTVVGVRM